ncbi:protein FAR1-RELATED SEQUENCE 6-like [Typha angustifolia]|uniref:protein FAR1-RELATED SEQUENCE 6-like n=1 Tax=Typha angustifolia TaxID=59011 RepID=UPI003C2BA58A
MEQLPSVNDRPGDASEEHAGDGIGVLAETNETDPLVETSLPDCTGQDGDEGRAEENKDWSGGANNNSTVVHVVDKIAIRDEVSDSLDRPIEPKIEGCEEANETANQGNENPSTAEQVANESESNEEGEEEYMPKDTDDALTPRRGMVFESINEAFSFYKTYAYRTGFSAVRRTSRNFEGSPTRSTFTCRKGGKPGLTPATTFSPQTRSRRTPAERTECKAMMVIKDTKLMNRWKVDFLELEHNHPCNPDMVRFMKCFRELPESVKIQHKISDELGEYLEKSINAATEGRRCTSRPRKGSRNEVGRRIGERDIDALMKFFDRMQAKYPNFFYNCDLDEEGRLRTAFWADPRSRFAYQYFNDVIILETMHVAGQSAIPFAAFLGVNNHGQLVLLGCGLLSEETKGTYTWLVRKWLRCMSDKPPDAIITNYCDVILEAVLEVLPNARHRFCLWHITKKLQEAIANMEEREEIFLRFKKAVYDSLTVTDFENEWGEVVAQYHLEENVWLSSLYDHRKQWAPTFVNHTFWAGLSTTQRSEKAESFFDGHVSTKTSLQVFFEQYESVLKNKLEKESSEDLRSSYSRPQLLSGLQFEEQIAELYTINIFQKFQDEVKQLMHVICNEANRSGAVVTYIASEVADGRKVDYTVVYNNSEKDVWCICRSFQFRGILCCHALAVLRQEYVMTLPSKYILERWKKDFKRLHASLIASNATPAQDLGSYDELYLHGHQYFADVVDIGAMESDLKEFVLSVMKEARDKVIRYEESREDRIVDVNMAFSGTMSGGHSYNVVNVNLETDSLPMAPTDFMQVHPMILPNKRLISQSNNVVDNTNKKLNVQRNNYFLGPGTHM